MMRGASCKVAHLLKLALEPHYQGILSTNDLKAESHIRLVNKLAW